VIAFQYPDGRLVSGDYDAYASSKLTKGDRLNSDGAAWIMRDRADRSGITVYLFSPSDASDGPQERPAPRSTPITLTRLRRRAGGLCSSSTTTETAPRLPARRTVTELASRAKLASTGSEQSLRAVAASACP
jgi:hypothetical protein